MVSETECALIEVPTRSAGRTEASMGPARKIEVPIHLGRAVGSENWCSQRRNGDSGHCTADVEQRATATEIAQSIVVVVRQLESIRT